MTTKKSASKKADEKVSAVPETGPNSEVRMSNEQLREWLLKRAQRDMRSESIPVGHTITTVADSQGTVTTKDAAPAEPLHSDKTEPAPGNEEK